MSIPSYRTRKEVDSLQMQASAVNTALNSLVIGIGITSTSNKFLNMHKDDLNTAWSVVDIPG